MALTPEFTTMSIERIGNLWDRGALDLDPPFQRHSVWSEKDRRLLVQSIFESIPVPNLYLFRFRNDDGTTVYWAIDGKQRAETLLEYMGTGPLFDRREPLEILHEFSEVEEGEYWWRWQDLTTKRQRQFLKAKVPVTIVTGDLADVIDLFVRINSTGKKLTTQERRHARFYNSDFLVEADRLAQKLEPDWIRSGVISQSQAARMQHVELTIELMLSFLQGMPLNKKNRIDDMIRTRGLDRAQVRGVAKDVQRAVGIVDSILPNLRSTRFSRIADYYSLVLLVRRLELESVSLSRRSASKFRRAGELLTAFGVAVDRVNERMRVGKGVPTADRDFLEYLLTVKEGTDTKSHRDKREKILRQVLDGVFVVKDHQRGFSATQRRILWGTSKEKICNHCRAPFKHYSEVTIDHVIAHARGGRTVLDNAVLSCRTCNSSIGDRAKT